MARTAIPLPGDELFPSLIAEAVREGHTTIAEADERLALHKVLLRARAVV
jgi:hypothetical protein